MEEISTVGIDIAKSVFQVHAIDVCGNIVVRRQLRGQQMLKFFAQVPPCLIGIEACGPAHYWTAGFRLPELSGGTDHEAPLI
ncbi:transposase [Rhizobium sp. AN67]|nr:transposase [Rhizobium sp. AN67]SOD51041.1 Transposase [Rhizobium sp. AN6A]